MRSFSFKSALLLNSITVGLVLLGATIATPSLAAAATPVKPQLSATAMSQGVELSWTLPRGLNRKGILVIERDDGFNSFSPVAAYEAPKARGKFQETLDGGTHRYRARLLRKGSRVSSKIVSVQIADESEPSIPENIPAGVSRCDDGYTAEVLQRVNALRGSLPGLKTDARLANAAEAHALYMISINELTHDGWFERIIDSGFMGDLIGQNVAGGYRTPEAVVAGWAGSAGHYANIMSPQYSLSGIACLVDGNNRVWWVQNFGS